MTATCDCRVADVSGRCIMCGSKYHCPYEKCSVPVNMCGMGSHVEGCPNSHRQPDPVPTPKQIKWTKADPRDARTWPPLDTEVLVAAPYYNHITGLKGRAHVDQFDHYPCEPFGSTPDRPLLWILWSDILTALAGPS